MATVVALDASPITVLRSMRGSIIDAHIAYPDVLHVEVRDSRGEIWRLATQDAEWLPSDPAQLVGRSIEYVANRDRRGYTFRPAATPLCSMSNIVSCSVLALKGQ